MGICPKFSKSKLLNLVCASQIKTLREKIWLVSLIFFGASTKFLISTRL